MARTILILTRLRFSCATTTSPCKTGSPAAALRSFGFARGRHLDSIKQTGSNFGSPLYEEAEVAAERLGECSTADADFSREPELETGIVSAGGSCTGAIVL